MANHNTQPRSDQPARKRPGARGWRVTAFWCVVGIVTVAAILFVSVESSLRMVPAFAGTSNAAGPMNLSAPAGVTFIPLTGEVDFNERFSDEKREAKTHELPAQF